MSIDTVIDWWRPFVMRPSDMEGWYTYHYMDLILLCACVGVGRGLWLEGTMLRTCAEMWYVTLRAMEQPPSQTYVKHVLGAVCIMCAIDMATI